MTKPGKMSRFGEEITTAIPELSYSETSAGALLIQETKDRRIRDI